MNMMIKTLLKNKMNYGVKIFKKIKFPVLNEI